MPRWLAIAALAATCALAPSGASAQGPGVTGGTVFRFDGDYLVAERASLELLVVWGGDATVIGTVERLVVINGDAHVAGEVTDHVTVVRGTLDLSNTAVIDDVLLVRSDLRRMQGSVVRGDIDRQGAWLWPGAAILLGVIFIFAAIAAGLIAAAAFAAFGGRQLGEAAAGMTGRPGHAVGLGIATAILGPLVAALFFATVIGIPVGLFILLVLLPVLGLLGAIVAATWIGLMILGRAEPARRGNRPFGPAFLGLAILAAILFVPGIGFAAVVLLSVWGMGALVDRMLRGAGEPAPPATPAGEQGAPAPAI